MDYDISGDSRRSPFAAKVEILEERLAEQAGTSNERLSELRDDRDRWRGMPERLTTPPPPKPEPEPEPEVFVEPVGSRKRRSNCRRGIGGGVQAPF